MELTIEQKCPSCGASIVLFEDDRLIQCSYCDVNNYRIESRAARYLLPCKLPSHVAPSQLYYSPYLRFKGIVFHVGGSTVSYKIIDSTRTALEERQLPVSLGLRPQAMNLIPVLSSAEGAFIQQTVEDETVFAHAAMLTTLSSTNRKQEIFHRAFIGETLSRIYQPYYLHENRVFDAVVNTPIGKTNWLSNHMAAACLSNKSWEPQFISTICPSCSGLLSGQRDSLVLQCLNCESLWHEKSLRFRPLSWKTVESNESSMEYLPFWQIAFTTAGQWLNSFGDYLRFTNQPMVINAVQDSRPLSFWIPAFKLNPKAFLQVSAGLTLSQCRIPPGTQGKHVHGHPVTLSQKEAEQSIKSVLAVTTLNKSTRFPLFPSMVIKDTVCELMYLPFIRQAHDFVQEHTSVTINGAALRFGRNL